jgi:ABC-type transporter Mla MlaB component
MGSPASPGLRLRIRGPIRRSDVPGLCDRVCTLLTANPGAGIADCDVRGVGADAVAVDALCRLQLAARRHGCTVRLRNCSEALRELVTFLGLSDILPE